MIPQRPSDTRGHVPRPGTAAAKTVTFQGVPATHHPDTAASGAEEMAVTGDPSRSHGQAPAASASSSSSGSANKPPPAVAVAKDDDGLPPGEDDDIPEDWGNDEDDDEVF